MGNSQSDKGARERLADAIEAETLAKEQVDDARRAVERAGKLIFDLQDDVDRLTREIDEAERNPSAIVTALARGGDVAEITRSASELRQKLAAKEREIAVLRQARDASEQEIPVRQNALDWAGREAQRAAAAVIAAEVNVAKLIEAAGKAQEAVLQHRATLGALNRALPDGEARTTVSQFLAVPWLIDEVRGDWVKHASAVRVAAWVDALRKSASAEGPPL